MDVYTTTPINTGFNTTITITITIAVEMRDKIINNNLFGPREKYINFFIFFSLSLHSQKANYKHAS